MHFEDGKKVLLWPNFWVWKRCPWKMVKICWKIVGNLFGQGFGTNWISQRSALRFLKAVCPPQLHAKYDMWAWMGVDGAAYSYAEAHFNAIFKRDQKISSIFVWEKRQIVRMRERKRGRPIVCVRVCERKKVRELDRSFIALNNFWLLLNWLWQNTVDTP